MRKAWRAAATTDPDYYLLLNDDTTIAVDALEELLSLAPTPDHKVIAVAAIADPRTGEVVCGGHKGHCVTPVQPEGIPVQCDTMNANCALVPRSVFRMVGGLHERYTHAIGDYDYGFTATRRGVNIIQSGRALGFTEPNSPKNSWRDPELSKAQRLKLLWFSPTKGLPFHEWCVYCFRNYGWKSVAKCFSPSLRILLGK
jgi:GT2 family glycosyltransferase